MNKFTKLLSVFVIAGAIGTGIAGAAGCSNKKPGGDEHTEHNWTYSDVKADTHDKTCSVGGEKVDDEKHVWGNDDKCVCGATKPTSGTNPGGNDNPGTNPGGNDNPGTNPGGDETEDITSVTVKATDNAKAVKVGATLQMIAEVDAKDGVAKTVTWSITNGSQYATIDATTGVLTGVAAGQVTVKATSTVDETKAAVLAINVEKATMYDTILAKGGIVSKNDFNSGYDKDEKLPVFSSVKSDYKSAGVYSSQNNKDSSSDATNYVKVTEGGTAEMVDPNGASTVLHWALGALKGEVEGYMEITFKSAKSSWTPIQVVDVNGKEILRFRVDGSDKELKYTTNTNNSNLQSGTNAVKLADDKVYGLHFTLSAENKLTIEVSVDDEAAKAYMTDFALANTIGGIKFCSSDGDSARMIVDNLIAKGTVVTVTEYIETVSEKFKDYKVTATVDDTLTLTSDNVTSVYNEQLAAIEGITEDKTLADVDKAYDDAKKALDTAILAQAKLSAESIIDGYRTTGDDAETFTGDQLTALTTARTNAKSAINAEAVNTVALVKSTLNTQLTEVLDKVKNDIQALTNDYIISISDGTKVYDTTIDKLDGDVITLANLKTEIGKILGEDKWLDSIYTDSAKTEAITTDYTCTCDGSDKAVTLYVKVGDKKVVNADKITTISDSSIPSEITINAGMSLKAETACAGYSNTINSNGNTGTANRSITITTPKACTITVKYCANGTDGRSASFATVQKKVSDLTEEQTIKHGASSSSKTDLIELTQHFTANQYTSASPCYVVFSASVNVYEIIIIYDAE